MAKEEGKFEIQWVTFIADVRPSSQSGAVRVIMRNGATRLYLGNIAGMPFVIIDDAALSVPATVPWHNVASLGWVERPAISDASKKPEILK